MDGRIRRFLVVENEYLIAIDAGSLLSQAFESEISTSTKSEFPDVVAGGKWDVIILDTAGSDADAGNANLALAHGAAIIFLTAYRHLSRGLPGFQDWPVVMKPFSLETLSEAVIAALTQAGRL